MQSYLVKHLQNTAAPLLALNMLSTAYKITINKMYIVKSDYFADQKVAPKS